MRKIKLSIIFLIVGVLIGTVVVKAESNEQAQPAKIKPKAVKEIKPNPADIPQAPAITGSKQGYQLVTDVLDGVGGASESVNYRMLVSSGGQPSAIGISESDNFTTEAGYVYTAHVNHGDANGDGEIEIGDVVVLIGYLFRNGPAPDPLEVGDATCDGEVSVDDVVYLISYLFRNGPPPGCC
jgi:hypothetical protein